MTSTRRPALRVVRAERILTMDDAQPWASVLVLEGDRVLSTGDDSILSLHADFEVTDFGARTIVPGFIDAHNHLTLAALQPLWADLSDVADAASVQRKLRDASPPPGGIDGWVRGFGWDDRKVRLTRADLDEVEPDRPVIVGHFSWHECVVNSAALDRLHITERTADPRGGRIGRDSRGRPTGVLVERAWSNAHAVSVTAYQEPDRWGELIRERCRAMVREGITAVHEAACSPAAEAVLRTMRRRGELPISVLMNPHPSSILGPLDASRLDGPPTGEGDELLRVGPVKLFADGGSRPALSGHIDGNRVETGIGFGPVADDIRRAGERGFGVAVHVMGNVMLAETLAAFEEIRDRAPILRIEHATLASRDHAARMALVGAVAVVQPNFVPLLGPAVESIRFDEATWLPFRTLSDAGVVLAGSSDDPCDLEGSRPIVACALGETRLLPSGRPLTPDESVSFAEWLRAYTLGGAIAGGQQDERGTLSPGRRADFVVLDGDLDAENPPTIAQTWVGGVCAFDGAAG